MSDTAPLAQQQSGMMGTDYGGYPNIAYSGATEMAMLSSTPNHFRSQRVTTPQMSLTRGDDENGYSSVGVGVGVGSRGSSRSPSADGRLLEGRAMV